MFLKKIDCDQSSNEKILKKHNIKGYPTIRYYNNGTSEEYSGKRDVTSFLEFLNGK